MSINSLSTGLTKLASNPKVQRIVSDLGNESKLLPVALLELGVLSGRSYQAQKRGGYYEFKETLLEGTVAAAIWMGGVKILNKVFDAFFKNVMKIDTKMDWKQVANYAKGRINPDKFIKTAYSAKFIKLMLSVGFSIMAVGTLLPKYKQKLTRESIERQKKEKERLKAQNPAAGSLSEGEKAISIPKNIKAQDLKSPAGALLGGTRFMGTPNKSANALSFTGSKLNAKDPVSFNGAFDIISRVGYALENEAIPQLAVVDTGITGGRVINARNKDEALEYLFRDASSCVMYYFAVPFIAKRMAGMFDKRLGVNTMLDPKALNPVSEAIQGRIAEIAKANGGVIGMADIQKALFGASNQSVTQAVKTALEANKGALSPQQLEVVLKDVDSVVARALKEAATLPSAQILKEMAIEPGLIQGILSRAKTVAKVQADTLTAGNIRTLSNLLDDIVKTTPNAAPEVQKAAKNVGRLADFAFSQVQSGGALKESTPKAVEGILKKVMGSNLDEAMMKRVQDALKAIQESGAASGTVTKDTLEQVLKGGLVNDSQFVQKVLSGINEAVKNPTKHVAAHSATGLQESAKVYAERLTEQLAKIKGLENGGKVSLEQVNEAVTGTLNKVKTKSLLAKGLYLLTGIAIATAFLSYIIPKLQYAITKMRTGKDGFPGVAGLLDDEADKPKVKAKPDFVVHKQYETSSTAFNAFLKQYK